MKLRASSQTTKTLPGTSQKLSPLCNVCNAIDFAKFAWLDQPKNFEAFPGVPPKSGCMYQDYDNYVRARPKLAAVHEVLAREDYCVFCGMISRRLKNLQLLGPGQICIESSKFLDIGTAGGAVSGAKSITTARLAVVLKFEDIDPETLAQREPKTLLELQACSNPIPNVEDTVTRKTLKAIKPRYGGRILGTPGTNHGLFKFWLERCERLHAADCFKMSKLLKPPVDFFLIDVQDGCVVKGRYPCRYAALSYVWGDSNYCRLTENNYFAFSEKGSLFTTIPPATVKDAITITQQVGLRYLWVDTLCIIQDRKDHQQAQIAQMASIYSHALITIIAISGKSAEDGLCGVRPGTRVATQEVLYTRGLNLLSVVDFLDMPAHSQVQESFSTWYTRAWTMQEQLFSGRKLMFTENQAFWHCGKARWQEETVLEDGHPIGFDGYRFGRHSNGPYDFDMDILGKGTLYSNKVYYDYSSSYEELARKYMNRLLTFESDRINAFTGIIAGLSALNGERYIWGLPQATFGATLTWGLVGQPRTYATHTRVLEDGKVLSFPIPSWTWFAWKSSPQRYCDLRIGDLAADFGSEIIFYQWDGGNGYRKIQEKKTPVQDDGRGLATIWRGGPTLVSNSNAGAFDDSKDTGLLRFWTSTATVYLCSVGQNSSFIFCSPEYWETSQDYDGEDDGEMHLHHFHGDISPEQPAEAGRVPNLLCPKHDRPPLIKELLVVGRRKYSLGGATTWDSDELYLLIADSDGDRAYRCGTATISEKTWVKLTNRRWRLVTLG
jgi:hypothetical protein